MGEVWGQCTGCSATKTYNSTSSGTVTNGSTNWSPSGKISNGSAIVRFNGSNASYLWEENDLKIGGIILSNGADLTLDRGNEGNNPGFSIEGGCISIGAGSNLTLGYISELRNVTICVEEGGKLIIDSRASDRNDFTFENVEINLQGPSSEIVIGEADFILGASGVSISGWTGNASGICPSSTSGVAGSSGNISWTSSSDGAEVCKILSANASCGPAGCDVIVNGNTITGTIQDGSTICIRGNRGYAIDLQNKDNLTICIASGVTLSGLFTNYNSSKKITVNVYGTAVGSLTMNNDQSSFNVFSGGRYNNYGTLDVQKGNVSNQGTITNTINLSNSSSFYNSGTQSGQTVANNSASVVNTALLSGSITMNNTSSFTNSGTSSNTVRINNTANFTNTGTQSGQVTIDNNAVYINNGIQTGNLTINASGSVTNNGTLNISTLSFDTNVATMTFNNSASSTLIVSNSTTMAGTISLNGSSTFNDNVTFFTNNNPTTVTLNGKAIFKKNLNLLANNGSNDVTVNIGETGGIDVTETLTISRNGIINLTNNSTISPQPYIKAKNLTFSDAGGRGGKLNAGENTDVIISNQTLINGAAGSQLNIEGTYSTNTVNSGGSGGSINLGENAKLTVSTDFNLNGNLNVTIEGELDAGSIKSNGAGGNSLLIKTTGKVSIDDDLNINGYPFTTQGEASIHVGGDLLVTNSGQSKVYINDNTVFYVNGDTSIGNLVQINDDAFVTFKGSVNVSDSGDASLTLNDNADILIQTNLTKSSYWSGSVIVNGSSQLVICNERRPSGTVTGDFPTDESNDKITIATSPAYYGGCRILPVEFLSFTADYLSQSRSAKLNWVSAKEWENSHFEIERGLNSVTEWETVGEVEGSGYSDVVQSYQFTDGALPPTGGYIYYRIKQVDFDGDFSYSATRSIKIDAIQGENQWLLYPNPSSNGSEIKILLKDQGIIQDEKIRITLSNAFGQVTYQEVNHPDEVASTVNSWLTNSVKGLFVLQIQWGSTSQSLKIIRN